MLLFCMKCLHSLVRTLCKYVKGKGSNYNIRGIINQDLKVNEVLKYMQEVKILLR